MSRGCCLFHLPCEDSVTFILRGAPIKPFRQGDLLRMLPERRAAPAGKWSESLSATIPRRPRGIFAADKCSALVGVAMNKWCSISFRLEPFCVAPLQS